MNLFSRAVKAFNPISKETLAAEVPKKNYLIIGGTAGIGKALATALLKRDASVTIVGRRQPDESLNKATFVQRDLSLMKNARKLAEDVQVDMFDVVVFTNGILSKSTRVETSDGIEEDLAVSYLSRYAFIKRALDLGLGSKRKDTSVKPRVFIMGFPGKYNTATVDDLNSEKEYKQWTAHMNTVVANEALVSELAEKYPSVNFYGLNPGLIKTDIRVNVLGNGFFKNVVEGAIGLLCKSADSYAENVLVPLVIAPELEDKSKLLLECDGTVLESNKFLTQENQKKIIDASNKLLEKTMA